MKYFIKLLVFSLLIFITICCQKKRVSENYFSSLNDTIFIKTKKIKGNGLFDLGFGGLQFRDTSDNFSSSIIYPKNINDIKRFQLKVDFKEEKDYNVELLLANKDGNQIFIVDENNNKDLTDDTIRKCEKIIWSSPPKVVKCKYLISNGKEIVKDSSWLSIVNSNGRILLGKREHLVGKFSIDNETYEIGIAEPRNPFSFTYGFQPEAAILSKLGVKTDSLLPTMAISNCLFSPTSENPRGFSVWCVLAKLSANPRNYS
jgi:hypothetical protein